MEVKSVQQPSGYMEVKSVQQPSGYQHSSTEERNSYRFGTARGWV